MSEGLGDCTFMAKNTWVVDGWHALVRGRVAAVEVGVADARGDNLDDYFGGLERP